MSRRWTEQDSTPPLDFRLALPATTVWIGCLLAVWAPKAVPWAVAVLVAGLGLCGMTARRGWRGSGAAVAALACCCAAILTTALRFSAAAGDPLAVAAQSQDWVIAEITVRSDPIPVRQGWGATATDDELSAPDAIVPAGANAGPDAAAPADAAAHSGRWRVDGTAVSVEIDHTRVASHVPVMLFADGAVWGLVQVGQTIRLRGTASPDDFNAFPAAVIRVRGDPTLLESAPIWDHWASHARAQLAASAGVLDADRGGLLRGLVVGDTRGIDETLSADAKTSGLTHLVAVSGTHMAIAAGAVLLLFRRFGPRAAGVAVAASFTGLVILVGPQPSVLRAVVMGGIGISAAVIGRSKSALSALAATVFALLLADPSLAVSVGFALSVQATAGLILLAPVLTRALERRRVPRGWALVAAVPIAAHIVTVPVITAISGTISLAAIPANIAVAPVVAPALLLGLVCLVCGVVSPAAGEAVARVDGPLLGWITGVAHHCARWPWAAMAWSSSVLGVSVLTALIVVLLVMFRFRTSRMVVAALAIGAITVIVAAAWISVGWPGRGWLMTMCDVGQGDGIVLSTDQPTVAVVVDVGPDSAGMEHCLDRLNVSTIALLVITHLHADHVGGLRAATSGRAVNAIAIGPDRSSPAALAELGALSEERSVQISELEPGTAWHQAGLRLDVLGPARAYRGTASDPNNDSVVLRATRGKVRMLLTGDIERPAQQALLDSGADLRADVLKQPHHGSSKLLPQFVSAVDASVAVIGVGAGNDYGHPATAALARDRAAGIGTILRTDTEGDVQVLWTGSGLATMTRGGGAARAAAP